MRQSFLREIGGIDEWDKDKMDETNPGTGAGAGDSELLTAIIEWVLNIGVAAAILVGGYLLGRLVSRIIRQRGEQDERLDETLAKFFASIAYYAIIVLAVVTALSQVGVQATSFVAILGAATLAIGLALQGALGHLAAGVMVIFFRPYKIGQFVNIAGTAGTVKDISLFTTELATPDNVQIIVPNGEAWGGVITNFSHHATRRVDLTFGISYNDDIPKAMGAILDIVNKDERVLQAPAEPWVRVTNLGDSSVDLQLRVWVKASDYWDVRFETLKTVKETFDRLGVEIPYPHAVHLQKPAD